MKQSPLQRKTPLRRSSSLNRGKAPQKRRKGISPASPAQRRKVREESCAYSGNNLGCAGAIQPAHLCARAKGGCNDELCVIPLCAVHHRKFDDGELDLWSCLRPYHDERRWLSEIQHALDHYDGDVFSLLHRLTGLRFVPTGSGATDG